MFGLTRRNQDISTYNPWREMEEFEKVFFGRPFGSFFDTPAGRQTPENRITHLTKTPPGSNPGRCFYGIL